MDLDLHRGGVSQLADYPVQLGRLTVQPLFTEPGSPWENGYVESVIGKCRYEFLNGEIFYSLLEAQVLMEGRRKEYNHLRPHSSLGDKPPAPEAVQLKSEVRLSH